MSKRHSNDYKLQAIKYYLKIKNYDKVCRIFDCKPPTLRRWIKRYQETGSHKYLPRPEGSYKVEKEHVKFILSQLKKREDIIMKDLLIKVKKKFPNLQLSRVHLSQIIRDNNITRKRKTKLHFPKKTAKGVKRSRIKEIKEFFKKLNKYNYNKIICLDETSLHAGLSINYSRCELGKRCVEKTTDNVIFRKYTLIVAISNSKDLGHILFDKGGINSERLIEFLKNQVLLNKKNYLVVMDNARAHKAQNVQKFIKDSGNDVLFITPYQHFLNQMEEYFNQLKHYIKLNKPMSFDKLEKSLKSLITIVIINTHLIKRI